MKLKIEIDEHGLKEMILERIKDLLNTDDLTKTDVYIEVKSKQNYKSEWESAAFRARVERTLE